jgi:hypothetical protein
MIFLRIDSSAAGIFLASFCLLVVRHAAGVMAASWYLLSLIDQFLEEEG